MTIQGPAIISRWERFIRLTVWHPINVDPEDDNRSGPRFWYPTYDLILFALGAYGFALGSPMLNRLFPVWANDLLGVSIMLAAVSCLTGTVFPKLNILELVGKLAIVFLLSAYAGTVAFLSKPTEPNGFVVLVLIITVWLLGPRITQLFTQVSNVRAARKGVIK